ncbi:MAG: hypothetical protein NPINA01_21240 [Nitrospinaceae bacterium]|nr:MAG: hypothetical protein NPINA01_21240 [Nitrospinaceae bacterium]
MFRTGPSEWEENLASRSKFLLDKVGFIHYTFPMNQRSNSKLSIVSEFWGFLKTRKKWWLGPIILVMLLMSLLIILSEGSAVAPFIYTLF